MRREHVDEPAPFQRHDAVDEVRGHDEAATLPYNLGDPVDRHFEASFGHVADLNMGVAMGRSHGAFVEAELDLHQLGQMEQTFGMTPSARTRVHVLPEERDDELEEFLHLHA